MQRPAIKTIQVLLGTVLLVAAAAGQGRGPKSYSDYFTNRQRRNPTALVSPRKYMYQKYAWDNPSISPYLQLMRPSARGSSYQRYVAPALAQRERQSAAGKFQRQKKQRAVRGGSRGNVPRSLYGPQSRRHTSPYHQQFYGNRR